MDHSLAEFVRSEIHQSIATKKSLVTTTAVAADVEGSLFGADS